MKTGMEERAGEMSEEGHSGTSLNMGEPTCGTKLIGEDLVLGIQ